MNNELYHYGVKGMKWGIRKKEKNPLHYHDPGISAMAKRDESDDREINPKDYNSIEELERDLLASPNDDGNYLKVGGFVVRRAEDGTFYTKTNDGRFVSGDGVKEVLVKAAVKSEKNRRRTSQKKVDGPKSMTHYDFVDGTVYMGDFRW